MDYIRTVELPSAPTQGGGLNVMADQCSLLHNTSQVLQITVRLHYRNNKGYRGENISDYYGSMYRTIETLQFLTVLVQTFCWDAQ